MIRLLEEDFLSVFRDEDTLSRIEHAASLQVVVFLGGRSGSVDVVDARHLVAEAEGHHHALSVRNVLTWQISLVSGDCGEVCLIEANALVANSKHIILLWGISLTLGCYAPKLITSESRCLFWCNGKVDICSLRLVRVLKNHTFKYATVSRQNGKYYVSITYSIEKNIIQVPVSESQALGLDYKSDGLYKDDTGHTAGMPKWFRESQAKLKKEQRKLRKKKGWKKGEAKSNSFLKQMQKVRNLHEHIANQRMDYLQKLSTELADRYDAILIEDLDAKAMANRGFGNGKATLDNGWGMFTTMLEYKMAERGKHLQKVDRWYPSSQTCSCCGCIMEQTARPPKADGTRVRYVRCRMHQRAPKRCGNKTCTNLDDLQELVLQRIREYAEEYFDPEKMELPRRDDPVRQWEQAKHSELKRLKSEAERRRKAMQQLYLDKVSGLVDAVPFSEMNRAFGEEIKSAESRIRGLEAELERQRDSSEPRDQMQQVRQLLQLSTLSRELVVLLVDRIVVEPKNTGEKCQKVTIEWNF